MEPVIIARRVGKRFRRYATGRPRTFSQALLTGWRKMACTARFWSVRDASFTVMPGQILAIIGKNGAGKSTLMKLIGGIIKPDEGTLKINGRIAALLEPEGALHPELTGRENVSVCGVIAGLRTAEVEYRLNDIILFAEAENFIDEPVRTYSTGMRMRLALSTALHTKPDVLLVDECFSVADSAFEAKCFARIHELSARGCAVIMISHDIEKIRLHCNTALFLQEGNIVALGETNSIVHQYLSHNDAFDPSPCAVPQIGPNLCC